MEELSPSSLVRLLDDGSRAGKGLRDRPAITEILPGPQVLVIRPLFCWSLVGKSVLGNWDGKRASFVGRAGGREGSRLKGDPGVAGEGPLAEGHGSREPEFCEGTPVSQRLLG